MFKFITCLLACSIAVAAQSPIPRIPGFNVGLNPRAATAPIVFNGTPAIIMVLPGDQDILTVYEAVHLPIGTRILNLEVEAWAVLEPKGCAVGAGLFFDTQSPRTTWPLSQIATTGLNVFATRWPLTASDPFYSNWHLNYCSVMACTSPCGTWHRNPDSSAFIITIR